MGGPIQVVAGQSVDLNIDFNACASIHREGNGTYSLKPTLTEGSECECFRDRGTGVDFP